MNKGEHSKVYFAGELFSVKHLAGNALVADAIHRLSETAYECVLPQTLEQRDTSATAIRNQDLRVLIECDCGIFHFDGTELDAGTVTEFLVAKFIDLPSVIVRSDFRSAGDSEMDQWNLMLSGYPRTRVVYTDGMSLFQKFLKTTRQDGPVELASAAVKASNEMCQEIATEIIAALNEVRGDRPILSEEMLPVVYQWMQRMPGSEFQKELGKEQLDLLILKRMGVE